MPYGISTYGQSPQIGSPLNHSGALIQSHMVGSNTTALATYTGSESNGSPATAPVNVSSALQTTSQANSLFRNNDEKRLTREAMERYLRNRNDMILVILHAKVIINKIFVCFDGHNLQLEVIIITFISILHFFC